MDLNEYISKSYLRPNRAVLETLNASDELIKYLQTTPNNTNWHVLKNWGIEGGDKPSFLNVKFNSAWFYPTGAYYELILNVYRTIGMPEVTLKPSDDIPHATNETILGIDYVREEYILDNSFYGELLSTLVFYLFFNNNPVEELLTDDDWDKVIEIRDYFDKRGNILKDYEDYISTNEDKVASAYVLFDGMNALINDYLVNKLNDETFIPTKKEIQDKLNRYASVIYKALDYANLLNERILHAFEKPGLENENPLTGTQAMEQFPVYQKHIEHGFMEELNPNGLYYIYEGINSPEIPISASADFPTYRDLFTVS